MANKPRKGINLLSPKTIDSFINKTAKGDLTPKTYADGGGLYLQVTERGASWLRQFTFAGVRRVIGLGDIDAVSLATAREKSTDVGTLVGRGIDPIKHRDTLAAQQKAATAMTFEAAAKRYYEEHGAEWRGRNTAHLFKTLMREHAYSVIGKLPVADLTMDDALRVLRPIWQVKNCSAKRLMFWCRLSIDATRGQPGGLHVDRLNPFTWVGCLKHRLPDPAKFVREKPHADLDYRRIPAHMAILRATDGIAERMAEFCILTTVRTRPIIEMQWREVDFAADVWNIPDLHEKSFEDHRVPLSDRALEILRQQRPADAKPNDLVWASARTGRQRSTNTMLRVLRRLGYQPGEVTQHGFRKSFANWRAEVTDFNGDMQEIALSHAIAGVRGVYQTGKMLERRRQMMQGWADFCAGGGDSTSNVVPFKGRAAS